MTSSVVIIEELTGRKRRVNLAASALPVHGASWPIEIAMTTEWNPGNAEATQHVLNPKDMPSDWEFEWRTNRLVQGPVETSEGRLANAAALMTLMEDIARSSALLRVTWSTEFASSRQLPNFRIVRLGRIKSLEPKYTTADDIDVSIEFEWMGRGDVQQNVSSMRSGGNLEARNAAQRASDKVAREILQAKIRQQANASNSADKFTLGQLESLAGAPLALVDQMAHSAQGFSNRLAHVGQIINTIRETPAAIAGRILDVATDAIAVTTTFLDSMSQMGPETQATRNKVSMMVNAANYFGNAQTQADLMQDAMQELAEQARARRSGQVASAGTTNRLDQLRNGELLDTHIPRDGETMASIALRYYGDPELGDELARVNGLPGYTIVPPRTTLVVPTRRSLENSTRAGY